MPFEPASETKLVPEGPPPGDADSEKRQISAVVWVFLAVGAILIGLIVVLVLFKSAKRLFICCAV